jgi:hypothetical protein
VIEIVWRLQANPEAEAQRIAASSESEARELVHRGIRERWLSHVVRSLNWLEQKQGAESVARSALQRLGFLVAR